MASNGVLYLSSLIGKGTVKDTEILLSEGNIGHLFEFDPSGLELYEFVGAFIAEHGKVPHPDTVAKEAGIILPPVKEEPSYYRGKLDDAHITRGLKIAVDEANFHLKGKGADPRKALETIASATSHLYMQDNAEHFLDLREATPGILATYKAKYAAEEHEYGIELGWETVDKSSGGIVGGDLVSVIGRPGMGKTFQLLYSANHVWRVQKKVPLFVSMEMAFQPLFERQAAMTAGIPYDQVKTGGLATMPKDHFGAFTKGLKKIEEAEVPFYFVDGNLTSTVLDVVLLCRQLKPDVVFIDGAYLLKHPNSRLGRYERVAENCDMLKRDLATICDVPVVASWQFSKEAAKKKAKKGEKIGLEDIGYSDAIPQHSTIVLGLFEDESVETINRRRVDIMKGRSGEIGMFYMNWDFNTMDFSETVPDLGAKLAHL